MNTDDTFEFSADISELMSLIINSFYSKKDIFFRELISNASDSLDKIKFESLTDTDKLSSEKNLKIEIIANKNDNTITIQDTGIGMTRDDLINNLGTVAKSGTKAFIESLESSKNDLSMIGRFGVGFYSAYIVSKNVKVYSKHNDDLQYCWESSAGKIFTVKIDNETEKITRGTRIVLYLKDDMNQYLEENLIKNIVKKYSEFIEYPISVLVDKKKEEDVTDDENEVIEEVVLSSGDNKITVEDLTPKKKKRNKIEINYKEFDLINIQKPIWLRNKEDITTDEYGSFFRSFTGSQDWDDYLYMDNSKCEGHLEFNSILFLPEKMFDKMYSKSVAIKSNIKLYVRKVFITDHCEDIIPEYLCFVAGIINIDELNLNISRETMQENKNLQIVKKNITKKCINMITGLSEDKDKYKIFYKEFSKYIKIGAGQEVDSNFDKLCTLLRYYSTKSENEWTTLDDYISRMQEGQKNIYYITGESRDSVKNTPFLEKLKNKNYEVLYMVDAADEYLLLRLTEYKDNKLISITKGELILEETSEEKEKFEKDKKNCEDLCKLIKEILGDSVLKVEVTNRLSDTPTCLISDINGYSANMERIIKSESFKYSKKNKSARIFEINPSHSIIKTLCNNIKIDRKSEHVKETIMTLYDLSVITTGLTLSDSLNFKNRVISLIKKDLDMPTV